MAGDGAGKAEYSEVIGLGGAAREDNLIGLGLEQLGEAFACVFQGLACEPAGAMAAGGIARKIQEIGPHRLPNFGKHGSRGIVVEVNRFHLEKKPAAGDGSMAALAWTPAVRLFSFYFDWATVGSDSLRPTQ